MSNGMTLEQKMVEVRKAYRLLHGYHKRLVDVGGIIFSQFRDAVYYRQELSSNPYTTRRNPFEKDYWAWDATPLISVSYLFLGRVARKSSESIHRIGDYLLDITFTADSEYEDNLGSKEAGPVEFGPPERSRSDISLLLIRCEADSDGFGWNDIWHSRDYPEKDRWSGRWRDPGYIGHFRRFSFGSLETRDSVLRVTKELVSAAGVQGSPGL